MLLSDDGAVLTIDDVEVINNDGIHGAVPLEATVRMSAGQRNFRVRYFQGPREGIALMLAWKRPGTTHHQYQYLPLSLIGRPPASS
jgi:alpha-N-arabinofuranosidase